MVLLRFDVHSRTRLISNSPFNSGERRTVSTLALLYSARMVGLFMVLPILVVYGQALEGATPAMLGLALGVYGLTQAVLQIPMGWVSDRLGRKPVIIFGLIIFALGSALAAQASSVTELVVGRALQGGGAIAGVIMALLADATRPDQRTKAMAVVGISIGLSFGVALVLGPVVASAFGLQGVFNLTAVFALIGIVLVVFLLPSPPKMAEDNQQHLEANWYRNADLWRLNAGVFLLHFVLTGAFLIVPLLLLDHAGIPKEAHWKVYGTVLLLSFVGLGPLMRLSEKGGRPKLALITALVCLLIALAVFQMDSLRGVLIIGGGLWFFFVGFNFLEATLPSLLSKRVNPHRRGAAMGSFSTSQFAGAFLGGAFGGLSLSYTGPKALLVTLALLLVVWAAWLVTSERLFDFER